MLAWPRARLKPAPTAEEKAAQQGLPSADGERIIRRRVRRI
jgi:hypothetical protein